MKRFLPLVLILGCTTLQDGAAQQATPVQAQTPAPTPTPTPTPNQTQSQFKNLQVLPRDISRDQLLNVMRSFTRGLGVKCNFCHQVTATEPKEQLDFASDAKPEKHVARVMVRMTNEINGPWLQRVETAENAAKSQVGRPAPDTDAREPQVPRVMCWTCHRGKTQPETPPPPPPPEPKP
jgi:hypothetical protein